jgi:hypothetical protein
MQMHAAHITLMPNSSTSLLFAEKISHAVNLLLMTKLCCYTGIMRRISSTAIPAHKIHCQQLCMGSTAAPLAPAVLHAKSKHAASLT